MRVEIGDSVIELVQGDITSENVDAIVNAANSSLLGGGGVDGAIHRAAGPELLEECRTLGGCATGGAKITRAYKLSARHVIHAVGPIYRGGRQREPEQLADAYRTALDLASQNHCTSVAFPAISTGVYGYPMDEAAKIAFRTIIDYLTEHPEIELVRYVLFDEPAFRTHAQALEEVLAA